MATERQEATKRKLASMVAEVDQAELATRLIEIGCHMKRHPGATGQAAWADIRASADRGDVPAYIVDDFENMARAAIEYFGECVASLTQVQ